MKTLEQIKLGEKAYKRFIATNGNRNEIVNIARNKGLPIRSLYLAIEIYRQRIIDPKPTKEEEELFIFYKKFDNVLLKNETILQEVLKVKTNDDLNELISKFSVNDIASVISDYLPDDEENYSEKQITAKNTLDLLKGLKGSIINSADQNDGTLLVAVSNIIDEYLNSTNIFPDEIILKHYSTAGSFKHALESYASLSLESKNKYSEYQAVKEKRIQDFLELINDVIHENKRFSIEDISQASEIKTDVLRGYFNKRILQKDVGDITIKAVLEEYIESNDIYPCNIAKKYYQNKSTFYGHIKNLKNSSEKTLYSKYLGVINKRVDEFILHMKKYFNVKDYFIEQKISYTPLDIQLEFNMDLEDFLNIIYRRRVKNTIGTNVIESIRGNIISLSTKKKLSLEEIKKYEYSYNGRKMTLEDKEEIIAFLNSKHLSLTKSNITYSFHKLVDGELYSFMPTKGNMPYEKIRTN
jgi:hypothetical protein